MLYHPAVLNKKEQLLRAVTLKIEKVKILPFNRQLINY